MSAHPRVGGEHEINAALIKLAAGSSPRGRGTPLCVSASVNIGRLIPAWAGNTLARAPTHFCAPAHPRVGGEHRSTLYALVKSDGSSPRGRGTRINWPLQDPGPRLIPAWAGNTPSSHEKPRFPAAHPRVGGEHMVVM